MPKPPFPAAVTPRIVAGADAAYRGREAVGAVVVMDLADGRPLAAATAEDHDVAPYVPGRFYEREGPVVEAAWSNLGGVARAAVEVLLLDAHGTLHPEGRGLAVRVGEALGVPTVGVASEPLPPVRPVEGLAPGESVALSREGRLLGHAWRPREAYKPLYVSAGHGVDQEEALEAARAATAGERRPRPLAAADEEARRGLARLSRN